MNNLNLKISRSLSFKKVNILILFVLGILSLIVVDMLRSFLPFYIWDYGFQVNTIGFLKMLITIVVTFYFCLEFNKITDSGDLIIRAIWVGLIVGFLVCVYNFIQEIIYRNIGQIRLHVTYLSIAIPGLLEGVLSFLIANVVLRKLKNEKILASILFLVVTIIMFIVAMELG